MELPLDLIRAARTMDGDRAVRKRYERGELVRLRSGVYVSKDAWDSAGLDARYGARVRAASAVSLYGAQFSHQSAAAMWRLPSIGPWPTDVHVLGPAASGGRSSTGIRRHGLGLDPTPWAIEEVVVSSLARTVVDLACTAPFVQAVATLDDALRPPERGDFRHSASGAPVSIAQLEDLLGSLMPYRGHARARRVIQAGSGLAGSVGESVSRVTIMELGLPAPELQVPFFDEGGLIGYADFYWPELDLIGEFDGDVKYLGSRYRRGRLPEQVVLDEKRREDRLRRVVRQFVRWDWPVAVSRAALDRRLRPFGLMPTR